MSSPELKTFCETIYQKVKLATAIYIIVNTPPGKSVVEYVLELQESIRREWHASDPFKAASDFRPQVEKIALRQHQKKVAEQLNSLVISTTEHHYISDSGFNSYDDTGNSKHEGNSPITDQSHLDFSEDVNTTFEANLDFVRGVVRLQALVAQDEENIISGHKLQRVINQVSGTTSQSTSDSKTVLNTEVSEVGSHESVVLSGVAKGVVEYTLQSSSAEMLVKKSIQEILRHLCGVALQSAALHSTILHWEGSLIKHSIAVIRQLSCNKTYQKTISRACSGLFRVLLADILRDSGCAENTKREEQSSVLLQVCGEATICAESLDLLTEKINILSQEIDDINTELKDSSVYEYERLAQDENFYYIFHLTEKLLKRYYSLQQSNILTAADQPRRISQESKISHLWRNNWGKDVARDGVQVLPDETENSFPTVTENWRVSLENTAAKCSFYHPLVTFYAFTCLRIITQNEKFSKSENVECQEVQESSSIAVNKIQSQI